MNIVMAMNMDGNDFIVKPFDFNILIAKVQAMVRRTYDFVGQVNTLTHQDVLLNLNDATLHYRGKKIELTKDGIYGEVMKKNHAYFGFWSYIKDKRRGWIPLGISCLIFVLLFYVYQLPFMVLFYGILLSSFVGGVAFFIVFIVIIESIRHWCKVRWLFYTTIQIFQRQ